MEKITIYNVKTVVTKKGGRGIPTLALALLLIASVLPGEATPVMVVVNDIYKPAWSGGVDLYETNGSVVGGSTSQNTLQLRKNGGTALLAEFGITGSSDLTNLQVDSSAAGKVAVSFAGVANISATHTLYLPITQFDGVYVCPSATTLAGVTETCGSKIAFTLAECRAGTTRSGATCTISGRSYRVSGLTSTGLGLTNATRQLFWNRDTGAFSAGDNANATGYASVALGNGDATGYLSLAAAGGYATGNYSIAMGLVSLASAESGLAMGFNTIASAASAVAIGNSTNASAYGAFAIGQNIAATAANSYAIGRDYANPTASSFTVGFGDITLNVTDNLVKVAGDVNATGKVCDGAGNCVGAAAVSTPYWITQAGRTTSNVSINGGNVNVTGALRVSGGDIAVAETRNMVVEGGDVVFGGFMTSENFVYNDSLGSVAIGSSQATNSRAFAAGSCFATGQESACLGGNVMGLNTVDSTFGVVLGGANNAVHGQSAAILGGENGNIENDRSAIIVGQYNRVSNENSAILGGANNIVTGLGSAALAGSKVNVTGNYSLAAGSNIQAGSAVANATSNVFAFGRDFTNPSSDSFAVGFGLNATLVVNSTKVVVPDDKVMCFGSSCQACMFWNGTSLVQESPCTR
jgi:hypothetical protein